MAFVQVNSWRMTVWSRLRQGFTGVNTAIKGPLSGCHDA